MKLPLILLLISVIFFSGCSEAVQKTNETKQTETVPTVQPSVEITKGATQAVQSNVEEKVETTVTIPTSQNESTQPKTYYVNVVQGVGVKTTQ